MDVEVFLARAVSDWTKQQFPEDPHLVDLAVGVALDSFASGASVAEACERSRAFVVSRVQHPAYGRAFRLLAAAS